MAKRFTDTNKYKKPFIRGLQGAYKLLWDFIYHDCDHAGIWIVDFDIAQICIGSDMPVNKSDALKFFNNGKNRIIEVDNKERWFIPSFIDIQYGKLSPDNRAHLSAIKILEKYKLLNKNKSLISPLKGAKDKDKDKDMDIDKDKEIFNEAREKFPGTKRGNNTEFENFKKHKDWKDILPLLLPAIENQIKYRTSIPSDKFIPEWKNFKTWIYQRCWEEEIPGKAKKEDQAAVARKKMRKEHEESKLIK